MDLTHSLLGFYKTAIENRDPKAPINSQLGNPANYTHISIYR
jgi:hypothetical protein